MYVPSCTVQHLQCPNFQTDRPIPKGGIAFNLSQVVYQYSLSSWIHCDQVDDNDSFEQPQSVSNQPQQGESNFGDSSGPIFSMYSKLAGEEDDEMVDRWQKDADGILIFVSPSVDFHTMRTRIRIL